MNAIVIGLGSMGRRRIRLLQSIDPSISIVGIDLDEGRRRQAESELDIRTFASIDEVVSEGCEIGIALVCTSPATHAPIVTECLEAGIHTFTELNLVAEGYEKNIALARERGLVLFLSSTFLYRRECLAIADAVAGSVSSYTYHIGQYLPDWHPWESWRDFFVANPETSGVREILAIELPWLQAAFGPISCIRSANRTLTDLGTLYNDTSVLLVEHEGGSVGALSVDVVCRKAVRRFECTSDGAYLTWDGTPDTLKRFDITSEEMGQVSLYAEGEGEHREGYAAFVVEDAYRDELVAFLGVVQDGNQPKYGFEEDLLTLRLIDEAVGSK